MLKPRRALERIVKFFHLDSWIRFVMLCVVVGIAAGLVGAVFDYGLHLLYGLLFLDVLSHIQPGEPSGLLLLIGVPAVGMFLATWIAARWAPEVRGGGTDAVIHAFHREQGQIRPQVPWFKALCTILTIGSGGSAGKEGPTAQIGAGVGSFLANTFGLSARDRRVLMLAGCAGGLGAVLRAPLGGALFAAEMLYREPDFEHDSVIPGVISSVTAFSVFSAVRGQRAFFDFQGPLGAYPSADGRMISEFLHYALLSLGCALVAFLLVRGTRLIRDRVLKPIPEKFRPLGAGVALGLGTAFLMIIWQAPPSQVQPNMVMGEGRVFMRELVIAANPQESPAADGVTSAEANTRAADDRVERKQGFIGGPGILLLLILVRIAATGLTIGSGASGGVLFPTLLIGALTGAAYGRLVQSATFLPDALQLTPGARVGMILVAMGGVFCGCTKTPIASLVMISEMSGSYGLVVPLMLVCASTYLLTTSFTLDEAQVPSIADSPAHRGDFLVNVLEDIRVHDALSGRVRPELIPADMPFGQVVDRIKHSHAGTFPIIDEHGYLAGVFSLSDIRQIMNEQTVGTLVVAGDLGTTNVQTVTMDTTLSDALTLFTQKSVDELPVVEDVESGGADPQALGAAGRKRVVAMLTRHDLISAYRRRLIELKSDETGTSVFEKAQVSTSEMEGALDLLGHDTERAALEPEEESPAEEMPVRDKK